MYPQLAKFVARILGGAKVAELPIEQVNEFYFVINLRTAQEFGITVPTSMLVLADEVLR